MIKALLLVFGVVLISYSTHTDGILGIAESFVGSVLLAIFSILTDRR